jgi:hypothetical protein
MAAMTRRLPSPSLAVSIAALVVAMGGTGYAATQLSGSNIQAGTITGKQIKKHSLPAGKLSPKAIAQLHGAQGPAGPAGPGGPAGQTGADGARGPAGPAGVSGRTVVKSGVYYAAGGKQTTGIVFCPAGLKVLGGGVSVSSFSTAVNVNSSYPATGGAQDGWHADVNNETVGDVSFTVWAICANVAA